MTQMQFPNNFLTWICWIKDNIQYPPQIIVGQPTKTHAAKEYASLNSLDNVNVLVARIDGSRIVERLIKREQNDK